MNRNIWISMAIIVISQAMGCNQQDPLNKNEEMIENNLLIEENITDKFVVYQLFVRLFGNKNSTNKIYGTLEENGSGKFNDISDKALQELKSFGITHLWYTGALEHAVMNDYSSEGIHIDHAAIVKGRAGSPYAIKDYYDVNPDLAEDVSHRMEEFESLVKRTHDHELKVLIDFVPNHVARYYSSDAKPDGFKDLGEQDDTTKAFDPNNNFYYIPNETLNVPGDYNPLGPDHSFVTEELAYIEYPAKASGDNVFHSSPSKDNWFETVKINYGVDYGDSMRKHFDPIPRTWHMMKDILEFWTHKGVDGFRCDFVQFTPVEFWSWVIPQIRNLNPDIVFIAEIYIPEEYESYLHEGKFDYLYDKVQLYDTIRHFMSGHGSTDHIPNIWRDLKGINKNMIRFLENHDEQRIASRFFSGKPEPGIPGMTLSATLYTGPSMLYFGQEVGEPAIGESGFSGDDGRSTMFDYWGIPEHQKWMNQGNFDGKHLSESQQLLRNTYGRLNRLCIEREALLRGNLLDIHEYNRHLNHDRGYTDKVYSYFRFTENEVLLIMVNFYNEATGKCTLTVSPEVLDYLGLKDKDLTLTDLLGSEREFKMNEGQVEIEQDAWGAYIFEVK